MSVSQSFSCLFPKSCMNLQQAQQFNDHSNNLIKQNGLNTHHQIHHQMFQQFNNNFIFHPFQYPQVLQQVIQPPYNQNMQTQSQDRSGVQTSSGGQTITQTAKSIQSSRSLLAHFNQSLSTSKHKDATLMNSKMMNSSCMVVNSMALSNVLGKTFLKLSQNQHTFYSFCMLLFPQHSKCLPIEIDILDTIFFQSEKDLVYVYKDSRRGLCKVKNKSKQIYQFFTKRKNNYQVVQNKQSKRKMLKENNYFYQLNLKSHQKYHVAPTSKSSFIKQELKQHDLPQMIRSLPRLQFDSNKWNQLITPDNTRRKNYQIQRLNYIALLRYKDNSFLRLKQNQFKAIFLNPLYANERFKNHNNTRYIQWMPQQNPIEDIKAFSLHFDYQTFHKEDLFKFVIDCSARQNQYLRLDDRHFINEQKSKSNTIKEYLKKHNEQVYLYYLIFQIYAYISMHYNKKLQVANFKFVKYEETFALSSVENIILNSFQKEGEFLRADLFQKRKQQELIQEQNAQKQLLSALSTPALREQFNKKLLSTLQQKNQSQNLLEKHLNQILEKQTTRIKVQFVQNINKKLDNIKNTKDLNLSKNVFKLLNPNIDTDFHQILQNQHKLKKLICSNQSNVYARKNISNFSVVRSVKRNRPIHSFEKSSTIFESRTQTMKDFLACTAASSSQSNYKFKKIEMKIKNEKRKQLNQTYIDFNKTKFKFKGL